MNQSVEHMLNKAGSLNTALSMPSLIQIRNGEKVKRPTFSAKEYQNRQQSLKAYMAKATLMAMLFTSITISTTIQTSYIAHFGRFYGFGHRPR